MLCREFEQRMQELLDERKRPELDADLVDHAPACSSCSDMLLAQERLFQGLQHARRQGPPSGLAERVVSITVTRRRMRTLGQVLTVAALAASLVFLLLPALRPGQRTGLAFRTGEQLEKLSSAPETTFTDTTDVDPEQYRALIQGLISQVHRLPQLQHVDQIAGSIRPLASTLNVAIDMLWRRTFSGGMGRRVKGIEGQQESKVQSPESRSEVRWGSLLSFMSTSQTVERVSCHS